MLNKFKRRWINWINLFLKTLGINVHQRTIRWYNLYQFGAAFPTFNGTTHIFLYALVNRHNMNDAAPAIGFLGAAVVMLSSISILSQNRIKVSEMLHLMDQYVYRYPDEENIQVEIRDLFREENLFKSFRFIFMYEWFGFSLSAVSHLIMYFVTGIFQVCIIPVWYPQYGDGIVGLGFTLFLQLMTCLGSFWIYNVSQILITSLTLEFIRQTERLKGAIRSIRGRTEQMMEKFKSKDEEVSNLKQLKDLSEVYDELYRENVLHCVKHHQKLWKLFNDLKPWFSSFYSVELAMSVASFALAFYSVFFIKDFAGLLSFSGVAVLLLSNLFSRCIVGEVFKKLNEEIKDTIFYEVTWWDESVQNRKILSIFHCLAKQDFSLTAFSIYTASFYTFSQIVQVSYSFFNLVRSSLSD